MVLQTALQNIIPMNEQKLKHTASMLARQYWEKVCLLTSECSLLVLVVCLQLISPLPDVSVVRSIQLLAWSAACGDVSLSSDPTSIHNAFTMVSRAPLPTAAVSLCFPLTSSPPPHLVEWTQKTCTWPETLLRCSVSALPSPPMSSPHWRAHRTGNTLSLTPFSSSEIGEILHILLLVCVTCFHVQTYQDHCCRPTLLHSYKVQCQYPQLHQLHFTSFLWCRSEHSYWYRKVCLKCVYLVCSL